MRLTRTPPIPHRLPPTTETVSLTIVCYAIISVLAHTSSAIHIYVPDTRECVCVRVFAYSIKINDLSIVYVRCGWAKGKLH